MRLATACALGALLCSGEAARGMCRVVVEKGTLPPIVEPQQAVLLVLQRMVSVGQVCRSGDTDGGALDDGGSQSLDPDAGTLYSPPDASCTPRIGNAVTMVVQPTISSRGDGAHFALLMVTPDVPVVSLAPASLFHDLAVATAPAVVHQQKTVEDPKLGEQCSFGCGLDSSSIGNRGLPPDYQPPAPGNQDAGLPPDLTTLGAYELAVLGGADLAAVENWLTAHNYFFDANDVAALAPYLASGWTVTAVRVRSTPISKTPLTPIAFTFESDVLRLPVAVARDPSGGQMPLTAYVAAEGRYDFSGASVPYAEYSAAVRATEFLTRNDLRIDLSAPIDLDPIAYRDYQNTEHQDTVTVVDEVHVPVTKCDWGCRGCACSVSGERVVPFPALALLALLGFRVLRRRRR